MDIKSALQEIAKDGSGSFNLGDIVKVKDITEFTNYTLGRQYCRVTALFLCNKEVQLSMKEAVVYDMEDNTALVFFMVSRNDCI